MKSYAFRLEKILDYRSCLRKRAQQAVFNSRNKYMKTEKEILGLVDNKTETSEKCSLEGSTGVSVPLYRIYQTFLEKIEDDLEKAHARLNEEEEKIMVKETLLKQVSIKKKALEILKDLQHKKYMKIFAREEQKLLDEIVIIGKGGH